MNISLNPTYLCNFRCDFCYLTPEQLGDKERIDPAVLEKLLAEIAAHTTIDHIDLYGGEIGVLPEDYYYELHKVIRRYYDKNINIVTNLSRIAPFFLDNDVTLSVSWDWDCRERHGEVYRNMSMIDKDLHVLVLASKCMVEKDPEEMIFLLGVLNNVKSVEIKPYSTNQANQHAVTHKEFEQFVKRWIECPLKARFAFINEDKIQASLSKRYNAFSDDHLYITPQGEMAVLDFDLNDNEYFRKIATYNDYVAWCTEEKARVVSNKFCGSCEYLGHCLTEHLRDVKSLDNSCNGYKFLLRWYDERMENKTTSQR